MSREAASSAGPLFEGRAFDEVTGEAILRAEDLLEGCLGYDHRAEGLLAGLWL